MRARIIGAATALSLLASPALAGDLLVDTTLKLCVDTHGVAKVAFAAAEKDGWTMQAGCGLPRTDDAGMGALEGIDTTPCNLVREKVTKAGKLVLVLKEEHPDWPGGPFRNRRCMVSLRGADLDAVRTATTEAMHTDPLPGADRMSVWIWAEGRNGAVMLGDIGEDELQAQLDKGPIYGIQLERFLDPPTLAYSAIERMKP